MKLQMSANNKLIAAVLAVVVLGVAFWMLLLSPKREEAKKLGAQVERLEATLSQHEAEVAEGEAARDEFPAEYQRLVVLGKAVPGDDDVASFLVQLKRLADRADGTFQGISLSGGGEAPEAPAAPAAGSAAGASASPTEVAASLLPLGAAVGPAGLAVMPYEVSFEGGFFEIANFIKGLDSLVNTGDETVRVDGRLVTIDSFSLEPGESGFDTLQATFSLTTFLTPPGETMGATPVTSATATPAATTIGAAP